MLEIRREGDPVLRQRAKPVKKTGPSVKSLLTAMAETMYANHGAGLAAPQVGVSKRAIVVDIGEGLIEMVNPEIVSQDGSITAWEGCLSFPGIVGEVSRAEKVVVSGLGRDGRPRWISAEGFLARALQHEIDHLDGILLPDRALRLAPAEKDGRGEGGDEDGAIEDGAVEEGEDGGWPETGGDGRARAPAEGVQPR